MGGGFCVLGAVPHRTQKVHFSVQTKHSSIHTHPRTYREYFITAEDGSCFLNSVDESAKTLFSTSDYEMTSFQQGWGMTPVKVSGGGGSDGSKETKMKILEAAAVRRRAVRALAANEGESAAAPFFADDHPQPSALSRKLPGQESPEAATKKVGGKTDGKGETELSMMFGNSGTSSLNRQFSALGFSKAVSTLVKRSYYGAGLDLNNFLPDSFTLDFAVAAFLLANATYDFSSSMNFINMWGTWTLPVSVELKWQVLPLYRGPLFLNNNVLVYNTHG